MKTRDDTLTVREFAAALGWSHDVVTRLVREGKIKGRKKNPLARTSPILIPVSERERVRKLVEDEQAKR